jgi:peptidyl-Lys metalloendopeptidase
MADDANAYLGTRTAGTRYTKWFGTYDATRYATVTSHFVNIKDAFDSKPVTVDCSCKESYYAYVYPTQPYKVYVCNAFWSAPLTGTDSEGGTLIHEVSHFNVVAGTDDWAYGQTAAASLAKKKPARAVDNADSHEYFGENTPALQ